MPVEAEHAEEAFFMEMDPDMPEVSFYRPVIALMGDPAVDEKHIAGRGGIDPSVQQEIVFAGEDEQALSYYKRALVLDEKNKVAAKNLKVLEASK